MNFKTVSLRVNLNIDAVPRGTECLSRVDFSVLVFSLSSHGHSYIGLVLLTSHGPTSMTYCRGMSVRMSRGRDT